MFNQLTLFVKRNPFVFFMATMIAVAFYGLGLIFTGDVSPWWLAAGLAWAKLSQLFGHNIGIHRFYTHRSFKTGKAWEYVIAFFSVVCGISPPIHYVYLHRLHHKYSDTDLDPHNPSHGALRAIFGLWIVQWHDNPGHKVPIKDCFRDPICYGATKYYYQLWAALMLIFLLLNWKISVFVLAFGAVFNYFDVNLFLVYLGHRWGKWGYQNYPGAVGTYNNKWAQIWTMGDGLHNNHHRWPGRFDKAEGEEFDFTGWLIRRFIMTNEPHAAKS